MKHILLILLLKTQLIVASDTILYLPKTYNAENIILKNIIAEQNKQIELYNISDFKDKTTDKKQNNFKSMALGYGVISINLIILGIIILKK